MKKMFTILLALVLACTCCVPALAETASEASSDAYIPAYHDPAWIYVLIGIAAIAAVIAAAVLISKKQE